VIQKEFRALLPAWAVCAVALLASANGGAPLRGFAPPLYFVGAATLGAMAIGHEFSHRTMGLLLAQPVSRRRVLMTKLGVLAILLGALTAIAWATISLPKGDVLSRTAFLWLPPCAALFITPWLTLASRSPVGGAVFTLSLAGIVLVAGEWIGVALYGFHRDVDAFRVAMLWWSLLALSGVGAVMTWWMFSTLQVIDGATEVSLAPATATARRTLTKRRAGWRLVAKELRLQQLALAVGGLYAVGYIVIGIGRISPPRLQDAVTILTVFNAGLVAILTGSMASAEERNWRTLDAQLLVPVRAAWQWQIKIAVALGLTFALALALPAALNWILPPQDPQVAARLPRQMFAPSTVLVLASLTGLSLYVSTLCSSGLWALLLSVPAAFAVAVFIMRLRGVLESVMYSRGVRPDWLEWAEAGLTMAVIALVLRLGLANHASADRNPGRIALQIGAVAAAMTAAVTLAGLAGLVAR
jgi:hypothetical protein